MPIQTNNNDVILAGHGTYQGGAQNFQLPANVDLYLLETAGVGLAVVTGMAVLGNKPIDRMVAVFSNQITQDLCNIVPNVYTGGSMAPNLILHNLGQQSAQMLGAVPAGAKNVFTVNADTTLSNLLNRADVAAYIAAQHSITGKNVRVFWAACAIQPTNPDSPTGAFHNAYAVAYAGRSYANANPGNANAKAAAQAAITFANTAGNGENTAGAIAAAAAHDAATSQQTQPVNYKLAVKMD
jgi:hypothetical protein